MRVGGGAHEEGGACAQGAQLEVAWGEGQGDGVVQGSAAAADEGAERGAEEAETVGGEREAGEVGEEVVGEGGA